MAQGPSTHCILAGRSIVGEQLNKTSRIQPVNVKKDKIVFHCIFSG